AGFGRLLTQVIFRGPHWKRVETTPRRRTDGANHSIIFEGSFPATAKRFPERRVLVRLLRDGEQPVGARGDVDLTLDVVFAHPLDDAPGRRTWPGTIELLGDAQARLTLNLFHRESEDYYPDLQAALQPVVSPYRVTPLLM